MSPFLRSTAGERHDVNTPNIITPNTNKPGVNKDQGKKHPAIDDPDDDSSDVREPSRTMPGVREPDVDE